jgi:hypothetical protein
MLGGGGLKTPRPRLGCSAIAEGGQGLGLTTPLQLCRYCRYVCPVLSSYDAKLGENCFRP